jgi:hypothetical protein
MRKRKDNTSKVWFERGSMLASGVGAAFLLGTERGEGATNPSGTVAVESQWHDMDVSVETLVADPSASAELRAPVIENYGEAEKWTTEQQERFHALAIQEATGELSSKGAVELENLTALRRILYRPRSGDEVLWEYQQRKLTRDLLSSLSRYVEFYETPDKAWRGSGQITNGRQLS